MHKNPACFGISICYYPESKTCLDCPVREACGPSSKLEALKIAEENLVPKLLTRFRNINVDYTPSEPTSGLAFSGKPPSANYTLTLGDRDALSRMTVKAQRVATTLMRRGIDIPAGLALRSLPFREGLNGWLKVGCQQLIDGGFTADFIAKKFVTDLGISRHSARSYTSTLISLLLGMNVIECKRGHYGLRSKF